MTPADFAKQAAETVGSGIIKNTKKKSNGARNKGPKLRLTALMKEYSNARSSVAGLRPAILDPLGNPTTSTTRRGG